MAVAVIKGMSWLSKTAFVSAFLSASVAAAGSVTMGEFLDAKENVRVALYEGALTTIVQDIRKAGQGERIVGCVTPKINMEEANGNSVFDNGMIAAFMEASNGQDMKDVLQSYVDRICPPSLTADDSPASGGPGS